MPLTTISLDFWGTLVRANPAFQRAKVGLVHQYFHAGLDPHEVAQTQKAVKLHYDCLVEAWGIQPNQSMLFADWLNQLGITPEKHPPGLLARFMADYQATASQLPAQPYDDHTNAILQDLAARFRLVLISNTLFVSGATIRGWLAALGWSDYFAQVIFSDEADFAKPDARIFALSNHPIHTHIGDNPRTDAFGAQKAGLSFIGINGPYHHTLSDAYRILAHD